MGPSSEKRAADGAPGGEWLVNVADDVVIPMTTLEVIDGLRKRRLSEQSLVWRVGMHDWTSIIDVPQLRLAAGSPIAPPVASRATQPPSFAQAEGQRRRNTLPLAFPALSDPASVRRPAGLNPPLAVYERPAASLTFSESGHADWQKNSDSAPLTPVPPIAVTLTLEPEPSTQPHSLAPTTAEAAPVERARGPGAWGDLEELLSDERRADQRSSRRVLVWAAFGSATLAAIFALWLLRSPARGRAEPIAPAAEPSEAPPAAPTLEAIAPPSATTEPPAPAVLRPAPERLTPRFSRRPRRPPPPLASEAPTDSSAAAPVPVPDATRASPDVAAAPSAGLEPTPAASAAPEAAPAPPAPIAPDDP